MKSPVKIYLLGFCLALFSLIGHTQTKYLDSLKAILHNTPNDTLKISVLGSLVEFYSETQPDSGFYYSDQMLSYAKKLDLRIEQVEAMIYEAYSLMNKGHYPASLELYQRAIKLAEDPTTSKNVIPASYHKENEFLFSLTGSPENRRLSMLARANQFLGILYGNTNNSEKELAQYQIAMGLLEKTGDLNGMLTTSLTMGRVYFALKKTDSALYAEERAYQLVQKTGYRKYLGSILINLGRINNAMGKKTEAMNYFRNAITESANQDYLRGVVAANLYLADMFKSNGQFDSTIHYQRNALDVANGLNSASLLLRCYNALAGYYQMTPQKDSIIKYQQLAIKLNDSLFNEKQFQQFENIEADAQQRKLEMAAAERAYRQRLQNYLLLGGLLAFLGIAIILWKNNRHRRNINRVLEKQKTDLEIALKDLRATQAQLVQSEKMASLGELTAGIAHEIQNPLNFVNNFSELNNELISDMRSELKAGKIESAINISNDIESNENKILEHGKRADSIVKSMLQHTRTGSGKKEEVNINELAEEYVRLAYHGWKAKDKSFNTKLETHFDESIPKIQVVPQDIGRVILNLVNNAFYAVSENQKAKGTDYVPTVWVETKKAGNNIEIIVKDNGRGIPKEAVEKIFQPFFTTKPAGQGTGLGLSLSYDIIKSHGGEIKLETVKGEGTAFIILI